MSSVPSPTSSLTLTSDLSETHREHPFPPLPLSKLDRFPLHIIDQIIDYLPPPSLNALSQTCKIYSHIITHILYRDIRITSEDMLSRLIGERFWRRPALGHTRRITFDCACSEAFRVVLQGWHTLPRVDDSQAGPLFEKVDKVVFAEAWTRSLCDRSYRNHCNAAGHLRNLVDPASICFANGTASRIFRGRFYLIVITLLEAWANVRSVSIHGEVEGGRARIPDSGRRIRWNLYDVISEEGLRGNHHDYWWSLRLGDFIAQRRGAEVAICLQGATELQLEGMRAEIREDYAEDFVRRRLMLAPALAPGEMPKGITMSGDGPPCSACEVDVKAAVPPMNIAD